jgi:hypothetical protein
MGQKTRQENRAFTADAWPDMQQVHSEYIGYAPARRVDNMRHMSTEHTDRGQEILVFLVAQVPHHPKDLVRSACEKFGITRQAVNRYLQELIDAGKILASGNTNQRRYELLY